MQTQPQSPFGRETQRYWDLRYDLFSRFDEGILIDREGLFSVKPEAIALEIGNRLDGERVLDAFCGVGGSAIGLARAGKKVVSLDIDRERLRMARHNAALYGVDDRIEFVEADILKFLQTTRRPLDSVYFDPPWGGVDYRRIASFQPDMFSPDGLELMRAARRIFAHIAFTVPKNFDLNAWRDLQLDFELVWSFSGERTLFATAYFRPDFPS